jgi:hypothetical protein
VVTQPDRVEPSALGRPRHRDHFGPGHRPLNFGQLDSYATGHRPKLVPNQSTHVLHNVGRRTTVTQPLARDAYVCSTGQPWHRFESPISIAY